MGPFESVGGGPNKLLSFKLNGLSLEDGPPSPPPPLLLPRSMGSESPVLPTPARIPLGPLGPLKRDEVAFVSTANPFPFSMAFRIAYSKPAASEPNWVESPNRDEVANERYEEGSAFAAVVKSDELGAAEVVARGEGKSKNGCDCGCGWDCVPARRE